MKKLRIGFLSTAGIGRKNWKAVLNSGNCVISAVASRDIEKSRAFIRECQAEDSFDRVPAALGSYEELLASPDVDAIYIPVPTGLREDFVFRAAQNGKHVLCEKPCGTNAAELERMLAACKKNSVQFMDGVMFMHSPRLARVREILDDDQSVGEVRRISSAFSFYPGENFFGTNIRANGLLEPAGCLGDLGWYSIRFALWTMHWQLPRAVAGRILSQSENLPDRPSAPVEFSGEMLYDKGMSVAFYSSFLAGRQQWVHVSGQKGWLWLPDFVHPFNSYEPAFEVNEKMIRCEAEVKCPPDADPMVQGHPTAQDTRMWRNFAEQVVSGKLNDDWPWWALKTQIVMDACHEAARQGVTVKLECKS
ncbi:MAG TPA: Gfo/Idh/MocA family oxidoreductase [Verrucomicrobiae bacterium]